MTAPKKTGKKAASRKGGTRGAATSLPAADGPLSHSDKLIAESEELTNALAQLPGAAPDDAPNLLQLHQIQSNRRLRANIAQLQPLMDRLAAADKAKTDPAVALSDEGQLMVLMADIEDFLEAFAADPAYYKIWVQTHDDRDLIALLASFVRRQVNPGEASSSSS